MRQIDVGTPQQVKQYEKQYSQFRGVDFSTDSTRVSDSRSPAAQNIISDMAGFPEKRAGWRYLHMMDGNINNLFYAVFASGNSYFFVHAGTKLYTWDETDAAPVEALTGLADEKSAHFVHQGALYLLDGTTYRRIKEEAGVFTSAAVADDEPYIPTVRIAITGNTLTVINNQGAAIGGHTFEEYESPNFLTAHRKCTMIGDASSKIFRLPEKDVTAIVSITVNGAAVSAYTLDAAKGEITFTTAPAIHPDGAGLANIDVEYTCTPKLRKEKKHRGDGTTTVFALPDDAQAVISAKVAGTVTTAFTTDLTAKTVTFTAAPAASETDNIVIEYTVTDLEKTVDNINRCTIATNFGYFNDNRIFLTGNPALDRQNIDYMSGTDDPSYFPYSGYVRVGADTSRIMGYLKQYDALLIIKADNEQDAQIYLRTAEYENADGTVLFPVKQGVRGVGAVSKHAMGALRDDPLFLAREGVFAVVSSSVKEHRSVQDRSFYVNERLRKEPGLDNAVAVTWNGYFIVCVNGHCYVADSRQQTGRSDTEQYGYEWYYWTNIPARVFFEHDGSLFFGSEDMAICRFSTDREKMSRYADAAYPDIPTSLMTAEELAAYNAAEDEDAKQSYRESLRPGVAINAAWCTRAETFGTIANQKNILKKGCAIMIKPYTRSSIEIGYMTDREARSVIKTETADILDFSDIDFSRITFNAMDVPIVIPINRKIKKFNMIQFFLVSKELNEGFGVYGLQVTYTIGGYVK